MIIDSGAPPTGENTETGRHNEGAVVFVGRASFRMTSNQPASDTSSTHEPCAPRSGEMESESAQESAWFIPFEESVVLTPPETFDDLQTARLPKMVASGANDFEGPTRRSAAGWMIGTAVILGATVTLSAQAVMRRAPGLRHGTGESSGAVTIPSTSEASPAGGATVASRRRDAVTETATPVTAVKNPTVVQNTTTFPLVQLPDGWQASMATGPAAGRAPRARSGRPVSPGLADPAKTRPATTRLTTTRLASVPSIAWKDPFAGDAATPAVAVASKTARVVRTDLTRAQFTNARQTPSRDGKVPGTIPVGATGTRAHWVDPFAD